MRYSHKSKLTNKGEMGGGRWLIVLLQAVMVMLGQEVSCAQYKVGDLDSWGIPSSSNPSVYSKWPKFHSFQIGDSLLFLYPPSQDSVIQVTADNFKACNTKDPILYMNDGNSLFNLTQNGSLYFTSAQPGHCQKFQKLQISVGSSAAAESPSAAAAAGPSYPTVFGSIPLPEKSSSPGFSFFPLLFASLSSAALGAFTM
ncbi:PREDICTED: mavicyanin [Tarenaya hassleriana]|uniref:mavicyanin n=1 Tax=Tarenaya hassleriana TaxID=28532 RepID=UPI00053C8A64|nr:PREDICTED: mavicyanin [Tarenaya hassleriana]